jgi:hypothetical protein
MGVVIGFHVSLLRSEPAVTFDHGASVSIRGQGALDGRGDPDIGHVVLLAR